MTTSERPPRVAVILVNWNGWQDCIECLDSLLAQNYPSFHVFLVDNASQDGSLDRIGAWCDHVQADPAWPRRRDGVDRLTDRLDTDPGARKVAYRRFDHPQENLPVSEPGCTLTLMQSGANLGFAGGNNVGLRAAGLDHFDYFWLLNTDTVVHRDALAHLVARAQQDPGIGITGSTLVHYHEPDTVQAVGGILDRWILPSHMGAHMPLTAVPGDPADVESRLTYIVGASMLVSAEFIKNVGYMQEDYFLYYEELDWAMRSVGRYRLAYAPQSIVYHKVGASSAQVMSDFSLRLLYRNRLRFLGRFFPQRVRPVLFYMAGEVLRHMVRGRWAHARHQASALWNARTLVK